MDYRLPYRAVTVVKYTPKPVEPIAQEEIIVETNENTIHLVFDDVVGTTESFN